jgi:hypothetical protein
MVCLPDEVLVLVLDNEMELPVADDKA